jgi:hypothetical protein
MSKNHAKLYEAAKLDSDSVKILNKNNLYAPSIYHCAQAVEKCSKSIHAYYMIVFQNKTENEIAKQLRTGYGHGLKKSTKGIVGTLSRLYVDTQIQIEPKFKGKRKQALQTLVNTEDTIVSKILDMDEIIVGFNQLADRMYNIYKDLDSIVNSSFGDTIPTLRLLRRNLRGSDQKFVWYIFLAMLLSIFLDKLEIYSRYPMIELSNNNITILNNPRNKFAIDRISEMISEMIKLVPIVWEKIDYFKDKIK